jgi:hypothetical protein
MDVLKYLNENLHFAQLIYNNERNYRKFWEAQGSQWPGLLTVISRKLTLLAKNYRREIGKLSPLWLALVDKILSEQPHPLVYILSVCNSILSWLIYLLWISLALLRRDACFLLCFGI